MPGTVDPQLLAKLAGLELRARAVAEGWLAGRHRSTQRGSSVEFAEHREYSPGDDLRYLDWKVFGKRDRYQVKQFEAETNFACVLLVDVSESMNYRSANAPWSKGDCARTAAAALAYLVLRRNDAAGVALFDSQLHSVLRPAGHAGQWSAILARLDAERTTDSRVDARTDAGSRALFPIGQITEQLPPRSVVTVVTDALGDLESLLQGLKRLRHARHDVILLHVVDPAEELFPFEDVTLFRGLEHSGEETVNAAILREAYQAEFREFSHELAAGCRGLQGDYARIRTDEPLDRSLAAFLTAR